MFSAKAKRTAVTYRYERYRAVTAGILETAGGTFLLLIAVRYFNADSATKAVIAAGGALGLLLTPVTVSVAGSLRIPAGRAAAWIAWFGAACYLLAALVPALPIFVACSVGALTASLALVPLLTHMYQENYPDGERGARFSRTTMIRIAAAGAFSWAGGWFLSGHLERFPAVLLAFAAALALSGWWLGKIPTGRLTAEGGASPLRAFRYIREDRVFRTTLASWMLMGIANLMMWPLRVEYLANPKYGLAMSAGMVALLTGVIPNVTRFAMSAVWGALFDRMNFFTLRGAINLGFAFGILTFFTGDTLPWLVAAAAIFGVASAGGDIAWSLWVTKIAPPRRVADYMAVHTFLNGVRSAIAPFLAFSFVEGLPIAWLGWICAGLIVLATVMLIPDMRRPTRRRPSRLIEEVVD